MIPEVVYVDSYLAPMWSSGTGHIYNATGAEALVRTSKFWDRYISKLKHYTSGLGIVPKEIFFEKLYS